MEIVSVSSFLDYYEKIWKRTLRVIDKIPHQKIDWKPKSDAFTFKDILIHMVHLERYMFAETVVNKINNYPGHIKLEINNFEEMVKYITMIHDDTLILFTSLTDDTLATRCTTPDNASIRVWKWLRAMIEHHIHHRGQIYTYLNLLDVKSPPLYGLTSEQVNERSN